MNVSIFKTLRNIGNKLADTMLFLSAGSIFVWGIVCGILNSVDYTFVSYQKIFISIILIMLVLRIIFINKYTVFISLVIALIAAALMFNSIRGEPYFAEAFERALAFFKGLALYIGGYEQYIPEYEIAISYILCGTVSIFAVIFMLITFRFFVLFGSAVLTYGIIFSSGGLSYKLAFVACIFGVLVFLIKYLNLKSKKYLHINMNMSREKYRDSKVWLVNSCAVAVVCLCLGAAYFIPAPQAGFKDMLADTVIHKPFKAVGKFASSLFSQKYFSLSSTGYLGKDSKLGGDAMLNDDVVMEVTAKGLSPFYLAGAIKDKYTGYSWENSQPQREQYSFDGSNIDTGSLTIEFIEYMFSNLMMSLNSGEFESICIILDDPSKILDTWYIERCEYIEGGTLTLQMQQSQYTLRGIDINIKDMRTFSVFTPSMTTGIAGHDSRAVLLKDGRGNYSLKNLMPKNAEYTVYYRLEPSIGYWGNIKYNSRRGIYADIKKELELMREKYNFDKRQVSVLLDPSLDEDAYNLHMFKMYPEGEEYFNPDISLAYEDLLTDVLIPYAEEIYEQYTVLPENFPKRVIDLAHDITQNSETDYDKADDIRLFLRGRYPYTLAPGNTPEDRDFVDYFLFDLQKGYCTSFASAFVTMCRSVGLPARYVEGYVTPRQQNQDGVYVVTQKEGHAWGEVYLEGYGWVRFESTPAATSTGRPSMLPSAEQYPLEQAEPVSNLALSLDSDGILNPDGSLVSENEGINNPETETSGESGYDLSAYESESESEISAEAGSEDKSAMAKKIAVRNVIFAVLIFAAAVFIIITLRVLNCRNLERKIEKKPNGEAVIAYFYILMKYLKFFKLEKSEHETVAQYSERIEQIKQLEDIQDGKALYNIKDAAEIFSKACYGGGNIIDDERNAAAQTVKDVDAAARSLLGSLKYAYYKYIAQDI